MYFGSVKFFRHLILTVVFGWIAIATVLAVYFGIKCASLEKNGGHVQQAESVEEYIAMINDSGYTNEDILEYIKENDSAAFENTYDGQLPVMSPSVSESETAEETSAVTTTVTEAETAIPVIGDDNFDDEKNTEAETSVTAAETEVTTAGTEATQTEPAVTEAQTKPVTQTKPAQTTAAVTEKKPVQTAATVPPADTGDYTAAYPKLYADKPSASVTPSSNTVFLTFDEAPSKNTYDILTILDKRNVKATFFISSEDNGYLSSIADGGHGMAVLAGVNKSYTTVNQYLADFERIAMSIYDITGTMPTIYRLPDSINMPADVRNAAISEMDRRGFTRCGYNCDSGDRLSENGWQEIFDAVTGGVFLNSMAGKASVVLFHSGDSDYTTVLTAEDVVTELQTEGYSFKVLDNTVRIP